MSVRRIDSSGDWTFGQGKANYIRRDDEIRQNVVTRLKSFKFDWFLDTQANIDWFNILGQKSNQETIFREVERVVLNTFGVTEILRLELTRLTDRDATILIEFVTIYNTTFLNEIGVTLDET
jgi:capsule polysaccharide export protein KpsE/RkpR